MTLTCAGCGSAPEGAMELGSETGAEADTSAPAEDTANDDARPPSTTSDGADDTQADTVDDDTTSGDDTGPTDATTSGTTDDDDGTTGEPEACPALPAVPAPAMKFDVVTFHCGGGALECATDSDKCLCQNLFDALNVGPPHFMAMGSDAHRQEVADAGNSLAVYVDDLNTDWMEGGQARAAAMMADAEIDFPCGVPQWFVVNEISAGTWPGNAAYRQFVIDFATEMDETWGKKVLVASPFDAPGANAASWEALSQRAWIGVESYLSGQEINATGNQVAWCEGQYQTSKDAYLGKGVPAARLMLFEHYGGTLAGTSWGRGGVSDAGWVNAIEARSAAIANVGFSGVASYAWSSNLVHEDEAARILYIQTHAAQPLP